MDRRKQLIIGLSALLLALAAALGLSLSRSENRSESVKTAQARKASIQDACASRDTFQGLKALIFQQASAGRASDPANFDVLSANAFPRMESPVVASSDEALGLTKCHGHFILELPPGAELAFNGDHRLSADVDYEIQMAADGSGPVYRLSGAEGIVSRLAAFNLQGQRLQAPVTVPSDMPVNIEKPVPAPGAEIQPVEAAPAPPPPVRRPIISNPSFDCDRARTQSELMVCGSPTLGAKDRTMAAAYEAAMDGGDDDVRRLLRRTRDNFLSYRNRCATEACVSQAYDGRMREIRDIAGTRN